MTKDLFFRFSMPDPDNHRIVVTCIREVDQIGDHFAEGRQSGIVGNVARAKDEGGIFFVEIGKLFFESYMVVASSRDVSGTTCTYSMALDRIPVKQKVTSVLNFTWTIVH